MKPSMYSILHSTGVCVKCQSDFSGLKSKTHGICHLERAFQKKKKRHNTVALLRVLMVETFTIKANVDKKIILIVWPFKSFDDNLVLNATVLHKHRKRTSPLSPPTYLHCDSSWIALHWLHFRVIAGSQSAGSSTLCLLDCHSQRLLCPHPVFLPLLLQDMAIT